MHQSTLAKTPHEDSGQHSMSSFNHCSSTHDRITASTFCNSAAGPAFSVEIDDFECTNQGESTKFIDYQKNDLSPIEEVSDEGSSNPLVVTNGPYFNGDVTNSVSRYHVTLDGGSKPGKNELSLCTDTMEQIVPSATEMSVCNNQRSCTKCPEHQKAADALEFTCADLSMQLSCFQVEEALSTLAIEPMSDGNNRSIFQPKPVNPAKEIARMMTAMDFESFPTLRIDNENELQQRFAAHSKITLGEQQYYWLKPLIATEFCQLIPPVGDISE